jgi:xylulokinase
MKSTRYFAGIDAGTTGTTVMLVNMAGEVAGSAYREYHCVYPHPGWVEQDIELVWEKICEASREVLSVTGVNPSSVASIGVSSQRGTFVCVDSACNPLHKSVVWNDCRASEQSARIAERIGPDRYQQLTGMPVSALWAASKIMWLVEHRPDTIEGTHKIINGQEFLLNRLGAEGLYSDPSSLTLNGMMDIDRLDWSDEVISAIGLSKDKFPPMVTPSRQEGVVSAKASSKSGFAVGTPVCRGGGDQQCAAVGSGVIQEGMAEITIGTAAMMVAHIDSRREDPDRCAYIGGHAIPGKWDMEGGAFATGACLRWWRDTFAQVEHQGAQQLGLDVYDLMTLEASKAPAGCKGHLFFPFLNGQVTPTYDNCARGGSIGLTLAHDRGTIIRSVLEGTAFELRMVSEALEKVLGRPFDSLRLTGGGAKSDLWTQIQSDVYGKLISTLRVSECTTFGAAILGAVAAGVFHSVKEAVEALVHTRSTIEPDLKNHELYSDLYAIFCETYRVLRESRIYERISRLQDRL